MVKVYLPEEGQVQVHQSRVCSCPPYLPAGFYWYGGNHKSVGRVPQLVQKLFQDEQDSDQEVSGSSRCTVELKDDTPESDPESVELEPDIDSVEPESSPQLVVKPRVSPLSAKGHYSLRDGIVAPQHLQ